LVCGDGLLGTQILEFEMTPTSVLVNVRVANNEIGGLRPIADLARRAMGTRPNSG
jgi:cysteine sulfinate desulfinase/cysteine desulfurase-like protein